MSITIVNGGQWGDEGKGKIVDYLSPRFDACVRSTAGDNAGHTVQRDGQTFKFRTLPSSVASNQLSIIGDDVMINPETLMEEIESVRDHVDIDSILRISRNAHLIMPFHRALDAANESSDHPLGTTKKGVGPAVEDKVARCGIRMEDLMIPERFSQKLNYLLEKRTKEASFRFPGLLESQSKAFDQSLLEKQFAGYRDGLRPHIAATSTLLSNLVDGGSDILVEGAQGSMNDLVYGSYPYVTSSRPISAGVLAGAGLGPTQVSSVISVYKPYQTRVGMGPVMCELFGETADEIRNHGREYGTVTGRPRRIMWFDAVCGRYTRDINGTTEIALTKFDVLDSLPEIRICTHYEIDGERVDDYPSLPELENATPVYETHQGWLASTSSCQKLSDLPLKARLFLDRLEKLMDRPVVILSVGPGTSDTIECKQPALV